MSTYTIRPLKWERSFSDDLQRYSAAVPMGRYTVSRNRYHSEEGKWSPWTFEYCFDEYYDESDQPCDNPAHGKQLAHEDWLKRILPALEEVKIQPPT